MQEPSCLQQILLRTDGTVTHILEACSGEPVEIAKLSQEERIWPAGDPHLQLDRDERVLIRKVLLKGASSGNTLMYAESVMVLNRLEPVLLHALLETDRPIGPLLAENRSETFREILVTEQEQAGPVASYFGIDRTDLLFFRSYRIMVRRAPIMLITEKFPITMFRQETHPAKTMCRNGE